MLDSRTTPELAADPQSVCSLPLPPHSPGNVGNAELRVISVELKQAPPQGPPENLA